MAKHAPLSTKNASNSKTAKGTKAEARVTKALSKGQTNGAVPFPEATSKPSEARTVDPNTYHPNSRKLRAF